MTIRTRFAPSPTGRLHVGGLRTALYAWAYARHHGGQFVLRIEDTDIDRNDINAAKGIIEGLTWAGIDWDEGPIYQTDRLTRYQEVVDMMLKNGQAYKCYDTTTHDKKDGPFRSIWRDNMLGDNRNTPFVIRCKVPLDMPIHYHDMVKGDCLSNSDAIEDWVLVRSSGIPTYNFAVVVDDMDMKISHVIRGDDHVNNTPKQVLLYKLLNATVPIFGHIPMILDAKGNKLSKRTLDKAAMDQDFPVDVPAAAQQGICPTGLLNYLARLGWSKDNMEVFDINTFVQNFDGACMQKSAARVDAKKLHWLNVQHLKSLPVNDILAWSINQPNVVDSTTYKDRFPYFVELIKARGDKTTTFKQDFEFISVLLSKTLSPRAILNFDTHLHKAWTTLHQTLLTSTWDTSQIDMHIKNAMVETPLSFGDFAKSLRTTLSDEKSTPPLSILFVALGQERVLSWLDACVTCSVTSGLSMS